MLRPACSVVSGREPCAILRLPKSAPPSLKTVFGRAKTRPVLCMAICLIARPHRPPSTAIKRPQHFDAGAVRARPDIAIHVRSARLKEAEWSRATMIADPRRARIRLDESEGTCCARCREHSFQISRADATYWRHRAHYCEEPLAPSFGRRSLDSFDLNWTPFSTTEAARAAPRSSAFD